MKLHHTVCIKLILQNSSIAHEYFARARPYSHLSQSIEQTDI